MVRFAENYDWVIFILLGAILVFIAVLQIFQRKAGLRDFFLQNYEDTGNTFPTWLVVSLVYITLLSTLVSHYIPIVPQFVEKIGIGDFSLNKFGFTFSAISLFYFIRFVFTFFFYSCIGQSKKWDKLYFVSTKFYFFISILLVIANFTNYYIIGNNLLFLRILLF
ncbi:MAG: DUF4271 domain-containing protein, partial [Cruoricaptor ignavus]|nr:DUF4271 domain-containing protein [Cruoricaptor ignavus]